MFTNATMCNKTALVVERIQTSDRFAIQINSILTSKIIPIPILILRNTNRKDDRKNNAKLKALDKR